MSKPKIIWFWWVTVPVTVPPDSGRELWLWEAAAYLEDRLFPPSEMVPEAEMFPEVERLEAEALEKALKK